MSPPVPTADDTHAAQYVRAAGLMWEWLGLCVIAAIDAVWAQRIGFHLTFGGSDFNVLLAAVAIAGVFRLARWRRAGLVAEYLALSLVMAKVFTVFSYLAMASSGSLVDRQLLVADQALGFHWLADFQLLAAHPLAARAMDLLYNSMNLQALYVCILLGVMDRRHRLRELFWLIFLAALLTNLAAIEFPALGPFQIFGLASHGAFLPDMIRLKSGHDLTFAFASLSGVISFPSFHTVLALAYAYGARGTGLIGHGIAGANLLVLFGIPFVGGHYLVDMIGGAAVTLFSLLLVRAALAPRSISQAFAAAAVPIN